MVVEDEVDVKKIEVVGGVYFVVVEGVMVVLVRSVVVEVARVVVAVVAAVVVVVELVGLPGFLSVGCVNVPGQLDLSNRYWMTPLVEYFTEKADWSMYI